MERGLLFASEFRSFGPCPISPLAFNVHWGQKVYCSLQLAPWRMHCDEKDAVNWLFEITTRLKTDGAEHVFVLFLGKEPLVLVLWLRRFHFCDERNLIFINARWSRHCSLYGTWFCVRAFTWFESYLKLLSCWWLFSVNWVSSGFESRYRALLCTRFV